MEMILWRKRPCLPGAMKGTVPNRHNRVNEKKIYLDDYREDVDSISESVQELSLISDSASNAEEETICTVQDGASARTTVLYGIETISDIGQSKFFYADSPFRGVDFNLKVPAPDHEESAAAIVVTAGVRGGDFDHVRGHDIRTWRSQPKVTLTGKMQIGSTDYTEIEIVSSRLRKILELVIDYDPGREADLKTFRAGPRDRYETLLLHYEDLSQAYSEWIKKKPEHETGQPGFASAHDHMSAHWEDFLKPDNKLDDMDAATADEVAALLQLLEPHYNQNLLSVASKLQGPQPRVQFDDLPLLYKPGTLVYRSIGDEVNALVIVSASKYERFVSDRTNSERETEVSYAVEAWRYDWTGKKVIRRSTTAQIPAFLGDKPCLSLPFVPAKIYENVRRGFDRSKLIQRGVKFVELMKAEFIHVEYTHEADSYQGQAIIDPEEFTKVAETTSDTVPGSQESDLHRYSEFCSDNLARFPAMEPPDDAGFQRFLEHTTIDPADPSQRQWLSDSAAILLPSRIGGLALGNKTWRRFLIDGLKHDSPCKVSNQLVECLELNSDDKDFLAHLVRRGGRTRTVEADFIPGKGQGQVIFLYGPSGTGKTLTAECVASDTGRPLLSLLKHDFESSRYYLSAAEETSLGNWFKRAARWGAILLLDEADILLESRTAGGPQNHLVTVLLRTMEYYEGILFLTTNRPGKIDDSFMSRITLAIEYPALDQAARNTIWQRFFKTHDKSGPQGVHVSSRAKEKLRCDKTPLNGREIRNIFQTAINLANSQLELEHGNGDTSSRDGLYLEWTHFERPLERHKRFKEDIKKIHNDMDEAERNRKKGNY